MTTIHSHTDTQASKQANRSFVRSFGRKPIHRRKRCLGARTRARSRQTDTASLGEPARAHHSRGLRGGFWGGFGGGVTGCGEMGEDSGGGCFCELAEHQHKALALVLRRHTPRRRSWTTTTTSAEAHSRAVDFEEANSVRRASAVTSTLWHTQNAYRPYIKIYIFGADNSANARQG